MCYFPAGKLCQCPMFVKNFHSSLASIKVVCQNHGFLVPLPNDQIIPFGKTVFPMSLIPPPTFILMFTIVVDREGTRHFVQIACNGIEHMEK